MADAVIVDAVRSPVGRGKPGGALSEIHPVELLAQVKAPELPALLPKLLDAGSDALRAGTLAALGSIDDPQTADLVLAGYPGWSPGLRQKAVALLLSRPAWALAGSFIALRYLFQLVPEFNTFLKKNPVQLDGMSPEQGSEFLGARMVGRWKSGKSHLLSIIHRTTTNRDSII